MPDYENKLIKVTDLLINLENPRFEAATSQEAAIRLMIENQNEKLISLAEHIMKFGQNPAESIIVSPLKNNWLVREGNRRVLVLKFMADPSLIPDSEKKLKRFFEKIDSSKTIKEVRCTVLSDEDQIKEWIRLKHTGENDGAGVVK